MAEALVDRYDALVCDLDGVVYHGGIAVGHAVDTLARVAERGHAVVYATNNASRPPEVVAQQLRGFGARLRDEDVLTSAQAAAAHLADALPEGAPVLAIGGPGVAGSLRAVGLVPVDAQEYMDGGAVVAVVQGYGPQVSWGDLAAAARAVQGGARWVATNTDRSLPTEWGPAPGNGTLVDAVRAVVSQDPEVIGKPFPPLYQRAATSVGAPASATLGVGDRLDTDIAGAHAAGMDALLVLTGVHGVTDVALAPERDRPRYVAEDLRALLEPYEEPACDGPQDGWRCGSSGAVFEPGGRLRLDPQGSAADGLRAGLRALWQAADERGRDCADVVAGAEQLGRWWAHRTAGGEAVAWATDDEEDADGR